MEVFGILLVQSCFFFLVSYGQKFSCLSDGGHTKVDWFIALKLPKLKTSKDDNKRNGIRYAYMDSTSSKFILSTHLVTDDKSAMGATIKSVIDVVRSPYHNTFARIFYNDQPPIYDITKVTKKPSSSYGHSKGTIAFDKKGGFWLIHSVPRFPNVPKFAYKFPRNAKTYGQAFLCVSFPFVSFNMIAKHLLYVRPFVYDFNLPIKWNQKELSNVVELLSNVNKKVVKTYPKQGNGLSNNLVQQLKSVGGQTFASFGKNKLELDITEFIVKKAKIVHALAQTWRRGGSLGHTALVTDVNEIKILGESYKTTKDHSKYMVQMKCPKQSTYVVCIGDLNRMKSQKTRGGGYLCFSKKEVWKSFISFVSDEDVEQEAKRRKICERT